LGQCIKLSCDQRLARHNVQTNCEFHPTSYRLGQLSGEWS